MKRKRTRAERAVKGNSCQYNIIRYNRAEAKCRLMFNKNKKESWEKYVSKINSNTKMKEVWVRVKKLAGKYNIHPTPVVKDSARQL